MLIYQVKKSQKIKKIKSQYKMNYLKKINNNKILSKNWVNTLSDNKAKNKTKQKMMGIHNNYKGKNKKIVLIRVNVITITMSSLPIKSKNKVV